MTVQNEVRSNLSHIQSYHLSGELQMSCASLFEIENVY